MINTDWLLVATYLAPVCALIGMNWSLTRELSEYSRLLDRMLDTMDKMVQKIPYGDEDESDGET